MVKRNVVVIWHGNVEFLEEKKKDKFLFILNKYSFNNFLIRQFLIKVLNSFVNYK